LKIVVALCVLRCCFTKIPIAVFLDSVVMSDVNPTAEPREISQSSPALQGESVAFTGTLASMTHRDAMEVAEQFGGIATPHVSRKTSMLIVGEEGWPLEPDGQPSQKLQQVTAWKAEGGECKVVRESEWLFLVGLEERRREIHGEHTPAMLSQLLSVPVNTIRKWERIGLIRAVRTIGRLPYFDFQEVAGARRIAELLDAGVPVLQVQAGLEQLKEWLPNTDRPLLQLEFLARGSRLLYRDQRGLVETVSGQRCFDFDITQEDSNEDDKEADDDFQTTIPINGTEPVIDKNQLNRTATEWYDEGCRLLDSDQANAAIEAFRMSLMDAPHEAVTHFSLGNALYRLGRRAGALERFYSAAECEHDYLEAWLQIGNVHAELGEPEAGLQAFDVALSVHPDYADVHWHKADLLSQIGRKTEAIPHWHAYLRQETRGPWAESARQHLMDFEDEPVDPS
jgi:tetratricopeptide (TPR) repeat protein